MPVRNVREVPDVLRNGVMREGERNRAEGDGRANRGGVKTGSRVLSVVCVAGNGASSLHNPVDRGGGGKGRWYHGRRR